ncbi:Lsr2 family protein [Rhodococcus triatomae]|uniref:Lsr2 protein n=1 Tax=Rhodococcus triatomae TaxID=300028 RepID=A0A1G8A8B8_9NOCA|nr:Lsr2 family protein [Rhodococcus triatomae]QNG17835.1 Lsr2 family protein [Rhodococcus triatomae]QNG22497.1 Lsr2 family protein [Rhodococcus triatomae]SDH17169.1 Lsr2 protein [Rhodococcus triatomae]
MATRQIIEFVDDIDETPIADGKGETIRFAVNGVEYEIDLNDKNAKEFHRKLDYYISHGTRVGGKRKTAARSGGRSATKRDPSQTKAIREWAVANGYDISPRGRIPAEIEEAYQTSG